MPWLVDTIGGLSFSEEKWERSRLREEKRQEVEGRHWGERRKCKLRLRCKPSRQQKNEALQTHWLDSDFNLKI